MVLEVQANTWQIYLALDTDLLEFLWVTNARALKDKRGAECSTGDNNLLTSTVDGRFLLARVQWLHWDGTDTNGTAILKDDFIDFGIAFEVKVTMVTTQRLSQCTPSQLGRIALPHV